MDRDLEKRWIKLPEVEVDYLDGILLFNDQFVSLPDITHDILSDCIEIGHNAIDAFLLETRKRSRYWGGTGTRPTLLVGRLALASSERGVFLPQGLKLENEADITMNEVRPEFRGHFMAIEESLYVPIVRRNVSFSNTHLDGTWLGLRRP